MQRWPNLFIAGAPRCGTSSLHAWLQEIPGIFMSRIKEPNYFSRSLIGQDNPLLKPIRDEKEYLALFRGAGDARYIGEASPTYLADPDAPALIERTAPGARVIVSLRDPVERLHSLFLMLRNNGAVKDDFMAEIRHGISSGEGLDSGRIYAHSGLYARQVERFRATFGDSRFLVLVFEELMAGIPGTLRRVLDFLGIDHAVDGFAEPAQRQYGEARGPFVRYLFGNRLISRAAESLVPYALRKAVRNAILVRPASKPAMEPAAREFLVRYYRDDVAHLEGLLGRRMPWRNFAGGTAARDAG